MAEPPPQQVKGRSMTAGDRPSRASIEEFLFLEAELLDAWDLNRWHELFTEECRYLVPTPSADPYASPDSTLHIIAVYAFLFKFRFIRLQQRTSPSDFPHSTTLPLFVFFPF